MQIGPKQGDQSGAERPDDRPRSDSTSQSIKLSTDQLIIAAESGQWSNDSQPSPDPDFESDRPELDGEGYTPERFRLIRERIDSGYYDRPAIVDQTVEKLIDEMLENIRRFYK